MLLGFLRIEKAGEFPQFGGSGEAIELSVRPVLPGLPRS
jgi:hypothetical protein